MKGAYARRVLREHLKYERAWLRDVEDHQRCVVHEPSECICHPAALRSVRRRIADLEFALKAMEDAQ